MIIDGIPLQNREVFQNMMTVPDCIVNARNKIGSGHGEAKFYIASKDEMHAFYGEEGFRVKCFMLKTDLMTYMAAIKNEYMDPSQEYTGKDELPRLWTERLNKIEHLEDIIYFYINDQNQIQGSRGYINSDDEGYQIIREIALPLVSYIYAEKAILNGEPIFYWKLFVDFDAIWEKQNEPLVLTYGNRSRQQANEPLLPQENDTTPSTTEVREARYGQGRYREQLLNQCHFCPFTMISDERLLIASHIKPWVASSDEEKLDPSNGFILSPLFDKLFDKGFITFTPTKHVILSEFLSSYTWRKIGIQNNDFIESLPMDERRIEYLKFHYQAVFKGNYPEDN